MVKKCTHKFFLLTFIFVAIFSFTASADVIKQFMDITKTETRTYVHYHTISISSTYRLIETSTVYRIDESKFPEFAIIEEMTIERDSKIEVLCFELWDGPNGEDMYAFMLGDEKWLVDSKHCKEVKNAKNNFITIRRYVNE